MIFVDKNNFNIVIINDTILPDSVFVETELEYFHILKEHFDSEYLEFVGWL